MKPPTIDPEFEALIPPILPDELEKLTASILEEGCRDALVVWDGLLIDGHHRLKICTENKIPYRVKHRVLADRDSAKAWIVNNQLGRRNLTPFQRAELVMHLEPMLRAKAAANQGRRDLDRRDPTLFTPVDVNTELAKAAGMSRLTIWRACWLKKHGTKDSLKRLRAGKATLTGEFVAQHGRDPTRIDYAMKKIGALTDALQYIAAFEQPTTWSDKETIQHLQNFAGRAIIKTK